MTPGAAGGLGSLPFAAALVAAGLVLHGVSPAHAQSAPVAIPVAARSGSDITGSATLADLGGGRTRVEVRLTHAAGDHPMHVHQGPCANPNPAPWWALANVQNGASVTEVDVAIVDMTRTPTSINVHRSVQDIDTIVSCADLVLPAVAVLPAGGIPVPGGERSAPDRSVAALALLAVGGLGLVLRRLGRRPALVPERARRAGRPG